MKKIWLLFFALLGFNAYASGLNPANFDDMYSLASKGRLEEIKRAKNRGLNIEAVDENGNTVICRAILERDYKAYNTFYAAEANPKPACYYRIDNRKYESFMSSMFVTQIRNDITYNADNREESNLWLYVGGGVVAGIMAFFIF